MAPNPPKPTIGPCLHCKAPAHPMRPKYPQPLNALDCCARCEHDASGMQSAKPPEIVKAWADIGKQPAVPMRFFPAEEIDRVTREAREAHLKAMQKAMTSSNDRED